MSTVKVIEVINRVETVLQDTNVRWPRTELQSWLNEAYLAIILRRPDANAKAASFTCAAGTRQVLTTQFPSALRLMDVTRNLAATSGLKTIRIVQRSVLDDQRPAWHAEDGTLNIQHYTFDPRQPKEFFVYPPALATTEIEVVYADAPQAHSLTEAELDPETGSAETIYLDDIYLSPILDWVLFRAYSKDAEYGANEGRAQASFAAFESAIGNKNSSDSAVTPTSNNDVT